MTSLINSMNIEYLSPSILKPYERNARTHSKKQIDQIAGSIRDFGFNNPILIDEKSMVVAGHGRLAAAQKLKMEQVPCARIDHLTETQKRAYVLADNKLALNAGWDEDLLASELAELTASVEDMDFDVDSLGFSIAEVDLLVEGNQPKEALNDKNDELPAHPERRVQLGDVWRCGDHLLVCGDSLDPAVIGRLMGDDQARLVFTDPPYNVPIQGHVGGSGEIQHREFAMAAGEMTTEQFTAFLKTAFKNMADVSVNGAIHFICMDWRHIAELQEAAEGIYSELKNLIVWVKDNGGMGTFYRSRHEMIFAYKVGTEAHTNSFELGQHGRYRTNVWEYNGVNSFGSGRMDELKLHPTVKPTAMIADAIKDTTQRGEIVLDVFGGSGSTLIAAHLTGRASRLVELDPLYCDVILARYEALAHDDAELVSRTADD